MYWDPEFDTMPWNDVLNRGLKKSYGKLLALSQESSFFSDRAKSFELEPEEIRTGWQQVPFMEKDDVRSSQAETSESWLCGELQVVDDNEIVQIIGSSGTTGRPTFFGMTKSDLDMCTFTIANMMWTAGIRKGSVAALTTGMPLVAGGMPYADAIRATGATLVWLGGQTTERMAHLMKILRPTVLVGTASFVPHFADRCAEILGESASSLSVETILAGGEPGMASPAAREAVLGAWGARRISEVMGLGDVMPGLWAQCEYGDGMHFTGGRHVYVELIDSVSGEVLEWENGADGEAVYTSFSKEANPMVRYRSRDHIKVLGTDCPCGRTSPRIRCIGRTDDMLIYKAMNIFPAELKSFITDHFSQSVSGNIQIVKKTPTQVRFDSSVPMRVELQTNEHLPTLKQQIEEAVRQHFRVRVDVELLKQGSIPIGLHKNALTVVEGEGK